MAWVLGLDPGSKRIGVAVADTATGVATPLEVWPARQWAGPLADLLQERDFELVVVGLPVGLSGNEGPAAFRARELADEVENASGIEVVMFDERYTTSIAEAALLETGTKRRKRREVRDKLAAAVMLQSYLNSIP